jgi:phage terminase small subunit
VKRAANHHRLNDEGLYPREALFVDQYLIDMSGTDAVLRAGYKCSTRKSASVRAARLMSDPDVVAAIERRKAARAQRVEVAADDVLRELKRLAFSDVRQLFDEAGKLKPMKDWPNEVAAAIGGIEVVKRNVDSGDGVIDDVIKVKVWDKPKALEMLAKHLQLFEERVKHEGEISFRWAEK